ncbi:calcium-binding protein [Phyllobacterium zundukense]|uniref:Cadherin-like domain-containing protein n=1 Tax=Phyllobacterium zundukense TaxID=1867719 RepID=A0A2N9W020_9HYPH|nr:cadherin-like domain-containing protein [Phyllobacterium zundukense]ATU94437.1 hypothetical protein BLM14_22155 [Phyllobacterium zundukense]PIO45088.1 hypothetical protein B5P45_09840 [Phyllobacterium zundukense]
MTIEVKGTKSAKPDTEDSYEQYVLKNQDKRSSAPLFFTVFLTGLALYLKSAFPRLSNPEPEAEAKTPPQDEAAAANAVEVGAPPVTIDMHEEAREKKIGSGGRLFDSANSRFELDDSPLIDVQNLSLPSLALLKSFGGMSFSFHAANDNQWGGGGMSRLPSVGSGGSNPQALPEHDIDIDNDTDEDEDEDTDTDTDDVSNRAPRVNGPVYLADVFGCAVALIGLSDLLRGAVDPDGDPLLIQNITVSSGTLTQTAGGWYFDAAMLGPVTVTYLVTDGKLSVLQTAQFSVLRNPPVIGTAGDDLLIGTDCADDIDGREGNDNIDSRGGSDTVNGGSGDDHIVAGSGNDIILAGLGDDIVLGGVGDDQIWGGSGNDRLFGDEGRDTIFGESGDDAISGGDGDDLLFGGEGNDIVTGDLGRDTIHGDSGNDKLDGGGDNDIVLGQAGEDTVDGGAGDDFVSGGQGVDVVRGGDGADVVAGEADQVADIYDGGTGIDTLDYSAVLHGSTVDLEHGTASSTEIGFDTISGFEILAAGAGDDDVQGSDADETIYGNAGDDVIDGAGGADVVSGGAGNDQLSDGSGADTVSGDAGTDSVTAALDATDDSYDGGTGMDTLDYSAALMSVIIDLVAANASGAEIGTDSVTNFEVIKTGEGADEIGGSTASESIFGNGGDDTISGGSGSDTLSGGAGNDVIADGEGSDSVEAGSGDDVVQAAADASDDIYSGQAGSDTLDYSQSALGVLVDLDTGAATGFDIGQDTISGFEKVVTGSGDDTIIVGTNAMVIEGGGGADTFEFHIPEGSSSAEVIHQILDFMVGDRIEMSRYEIFEDVIDSLEDRFEEAYGDQAAAQPLPIRVRHEGTDELEQTLIEVDMDRDDHYEMTINLSGHHMLMIIENPLSENAIVT